MSKLTAEAQPKPFSSQLPKKLVRLLRDVQAFIVEKPKQFDMEIWAKPGEGICDTVGCIAGHMALRDTPRRIVAQLVKADRDDGSFYRDYNLSTHVENWRMENIPPEFEDNFDQLFYDEHWPDRFKTTKGNVTPKRTVKRIDYFLETGR